MLRVGIIGLGIMGRGRLRYYAHIPEARVVAVADVRAAALRQDPALEKAFELPLEQVQWFANYRDLLGAGVVDMVDICLPTDHHREATVAALEAGRHVLCEKPMALSLADCDAMLAAQEQSDGRLMIAHCIRFWAEYEYLYDLLQSGAAGRLLSLQLSRQGPLPRAGEGWMCQAAHSGGAILDLHIHDVDYCQYLLGLPRRVYARGGQSRGKTGGYDYVQSEMDYGAGPQVSALAQWINAPVPFVARYQAHFERAYLDHDSSRSPTLTVYRRGTQAPEHPPMPELHTAYLNEVRYMVGCVLAGEEPRRCPPRESRNSVGLIMAAARSIEDESLVDTGEFLV